MRPLRLALAAALALLLAAPAAAQEAEQCPVERSQGNGLFVGMVSDQVFANAAPEYRSCTLNRHAEIGVRIIRQSLRWDQIEVRRGNYDWEWWDAYVADIAGHGIELMPIIQDAPRWRQEKRPPVSWGLMPPKRAAMANFAARLVRRYGPDGSFWARNPEVPAQPIRVWQIWNEPNLARYWAQRPNAREYVRLLWAVRNAIKEEDPDAEIVAAGMPDSRLWRSIGLYAYITQMYEAGARGAFDSLAVNAYAERPRDMLRSLGYVRAIMRYFRDRSKIWVTELGWGTGGPRYRFRTTRAKQAEYLGQAMRGLAKNRWRFGIRGFVHYQWQDAPPYGTTPDFWGLHTGLLDLKGREKPAYSVFKRIGRQLRWVR